MSTNERETKISTLNPLYLQAVRDEAAKRLKAEQVSEHLVKPVPAVAIDEIKEEANNAAMMQQIDHYELLQQAGLIGIDEPEIEAQNRYEPPVNLLAAKAALASKQEEINLVQQQLDRLIRIKSVVEPEESESIKNKLNELKLKRLGIQMALFSDNSDSGEIELSALDKQISELSGLLASHRQSEPPTNTVERIKLNAKIDAMREKLRLLTDDLTRQIADFNLSVVVKKAESYVQTLKAANKIRHELLALVELLAGEGLVDEINLGGELPVPSGFQTFHSIIQDELSTTLQGVEEAKARIHLEILP